MGKAAHVRLFSGTIANRDPVPLQGRESVEKVTQIRRVPANRYTDIGKLTAGDIGALYGLSSARTGDVIAMRGSFDSPVIHKDSTVMEARVPVAASLTYPMDFGILTGGKGVISSRFSGYEPCPIELGKTAKHRGIDPRDRAKWILHARQALQ